MITVNNIKPDKITFPDGTMKIDIPEEMVQSIKNIKEAKVLWKFESESEVLDLMYITGQLREIKKVPIILYMPYLPNARMDRIHRQTEVFTLKYFCNMINTIGFDKVYILDVHSSVGVALLNNAENISPEKYIKEAMVSANINEDTCIFFPDEGSCKRYSSIITNITGIRNIAFGIKERDWDTGEIKKLSVCGADVKDKDIFIIDDICAYGGTVYHSAKKLKELGCKNINVYFTHCENSIAKGKLFECGMINKVYTTDSICTLPQSEQLKIFEINIDNL